MKTIIIGGSAAGASVAARLRRLNEKEDIIIIEQSDSLSFATCAIPYYIGDIVKDRNLLFAMDPVEFKKILNVEVRILSKVFAINRKEKTIAIRNLRKDSCYTESYDNLVIATGGIAKRLDICGSNLPHVFAVRDVADMDSIKNFINSHRCKYAAVIGGGYIGMEITDNLKNVGIDVAIVERSEQILGAWDIEMANIVKQHLDHKNVKLFFHERVKSITENHITLCSGKTVRADIVIIALGIQPNIELACIAGLEVGKEGGIMVNACLRTDDDNIYALGDVIEVTDKLTKNPMLVPLASQAHKQARVVANNIIGGYDTFRETQCTSIVKIFDLTIATTGNSEKQLKKQGIAYKKSYIEAPSHAAYYPRSHSLYVKILFTPVNGILLGGQIVGSSGVDKRIDILAAAISNGSTVHDLAELELAYAPPYSTTKDAINIAGMVAGNILGGHCQVIQWDELSSLMNGNFAFIDVRTMEEYELKTIDKAVNIPLAEIRNQLQSVPSDRPVVVFCNYGKKGYFAYRILEQNGFKNVYNLNGGMNIYNFGTNLSSSTNKTTHSVQYETAVDNSQFDIGFNENSDEGWLIPGDFKSPEAVENEIGKAVTSKIIEINACGLSCPGPIMRLAKTVLTADDGDIIEITATDLGFFTDVKLWCNKKGHRLLDVQNNRSVVKAVLQKGIV